MQNTIIIANKFGIYTVKTVKRDTQSNYNLSVSITRRGDKLPLCGKMMHENSTAKDITNWANKQIDNLQVESNNLLS